jgi:nucleoside-diphosphate-sugar epimerase
MNILITGGAGFIGSHLVERLKDDNKIFIIDNLSAGKIINIGPFLSENVIFKPFDVLEDLDRLFEEYKFDVVYNIMASKKNICLKDPLKDCDVNAKGTLNLLMHCHRHKVKKIVHASTGSVYGKNDGLLTEDSPTNPNSFYGVSKLAGERYVQMYNNELGLDTTILRFFHVYGPRQESGQFGGVIAIFNKLILEDKPITIFGTGNQIRSFTHVNDVVECCVRSITNSLSYGQVYNVASSMKITLNEMIDQLEAFYNKKVIRNYQDWVFGDIKDFIVSNAKIRYHLNVEFNQNLNFNNL